MFVEDGRLATELGQCPYAPGTPEWRTWQHAFIDGQRFDPILTKRAYEAADARLGALRERVLASRTPTNDWHDSVIAEIEPAPRPSPWHLDDLVSRLMSQPSGLGLAVQGLSMNTPSWIIDDPVKLWTPRAISGTFVIKDRSLFSSVFGSPPSASPRRGRRTRGMTIEQRRLEQALSGRPITVRPSSTPIHSKRRGR